MRPFLGGIAVTLILLITVVFAYAQLLGINWIAGVASFNSDVITFPAETELSQVAAEVRWWGEAENHRLNEASGLAFSRRDPALFYAINDSGNEPNLYAFDRSGRHRGEWRIENIELIDWEAMTQFRIDDQDYLLIADVGDNLSARKNLQLIIVKEPDLEDLTLVPEWIVTVTLPDGARDVEAVAVFQNKGMPEVIMVTKRDKPPRAYKLNLPLDNAVVEAELISILEQWPAPSERDLYQDPWWSAGRSMPTGMAINHSQVVIVTYGHIFIYPRSGMVDWSALFQTQPAMVKLPRTNGREAVTFSADGQTLLLVNERDGGVDAADIYEVMLP